MRLFCIVLYSEKGKCILMNQVVYSWSTSPFWWSSGQVNHFESRQVLSTSSSKAPLFFCKENEKVYSHKSSDRDTVWLWHYQSLPLPPRVLRSQRTNCILSSSPLSYGKDSCGRFHHLAAGSPPKKFANSIFHVISPFIIWNLSCLAL